jgi:hypothetical protein
MKGSVMSTKLTIIGIVLLSCGVAGAAQVLFDFESEGDFEPWVVRTPNQDTWERSSMFPSNGVSSARFETPKWEEGMQGWPAVEVKPPVTDWSGYERLVFDAVNPTDAIVSVSMFITDSDTNFRSGFRAGFTLAPRSYKRVEIDLSKCPSQVNLDDIALMHFYMSRPTHDYVWHIDNMVLLEKGDTPPEPPASFVQQIAKLILDNETIQSALKQVQKVREDATQKSMPEEVAQWIQRETNAIEQQWKDSHQRVAQGALPLQETIRLRDWFMALGRTAERLASLADLRSLWANTGNHLPYVVAVASSMEKVLPRDMPVSARIQPEIALELARNEHESAQIVVIPFETDLSEVTVTVSTLKGSGERTFSSDAVDVEVVGYVETKQTPTPAGGPIRYSILSTRRISRKLMRSRSGFG